MSRTWPLAAVPGVLVVGISLTACHSYHIDATIQNHTGRSISLLEVDYPSASFGADALAADRQYEHRFQIRGDGPLKVLYSAEGGRQYQINGPVLHEGQEGRLEIDLLPDGHAEFHSQLNPSPR